MDVTITSFANGLSRTLTFQPATAEPRLAALPGLIDEVVGTWSPFHREWNHGPPDGPWPGSLGPIRGPTGAGPTIPEPACWPSRPGVVRDARGAPITGSLLVRFVVAPDGQVSQVEALTKAPAPLVEEVRRWLTMCRFTPAIYNGRRPVRVHMSRRFDFPAR